MNSPALDLRRFLAGCVLGVLLGILYGALRPPRRKHPHLCDLLFMIATLYSWLYLSFALCDGDIRLVYSLSLPAGILLEEWTLGRLLRPVFACIWKIWDGFLRILLWPWKNFLKKCKLFANFLFATGKKWGTIY